MGPAFATHTFSVAPTLGLLQNTVQLYAMAEGQYGRVGSDNGTEWGHIYNNGWASRTEDDPFCQSGLSIIVNKHNAESTAG